MSTSQADMLLEPELKLVRGVLLNLLPVNLLLLPPPPLPPPPPPPPPPLPPPLLLPVPALPPPLLLESNMADISDMAENTPSSISSSVYCA
jgi:hypothetical protein